MHKTATIIVSATCLFRLAPSTVSGAFQARFAPKTRPRDEG
jgi:hypothetical protein